MVHISLCILRNDRSTMTRARYCLVILTVLALSSIISAYEFDLSFPYNGRSTPHAYLLNSTGQRIEELAKDEMTACLYTFIELPTGKHLISLVSFASRGGGHYDEIYMRIDYQANVTLLTIAETERKIHSVPPRDVWTHICWTWSGKTGISYLYIDGKSQTILDNFRKGYSIGNNGYFILGQDQDNYGWRLDAADGLSGRISQFNFWDKVLSAEEVMKAKSCSIHGNVVDWNNSTWALYEGCRLGRSTDPCSLPECETIAPGAQNGYEWVFHPYMENRAPHAMLTGPHGEVIPDLVSSQFTFCTFTYIQRHPNLKNVDFFSYSSLETGETNEILVYFDYKNERTFMLINDKDKIFKGVVPPLNVWTHLCFTWSNKDGAIQFYINGELKGKDIGLKKGHEIGKKGYLILGQEQDDFKGAFEAKTGLQGKLTNFNMWDRVLTKKEVGEAHSCVSVGNVINWYNSSWEFFDDIQRQPSSAHCKV